MRVKLAGVPLLSGGRGKRSCDEPGADHRNGEQERGQHIQERLGAGIEDVWDCSVNVACRDPDQADDNANSANGKKCSTDNNQHSAGHRIPRREMPLAQFRTSKTVLSGTSRIGISLPVENYGPLER